MKNKFTRNVVMFMFCIMTIFMVCSFTGCKEPVIPESSTEDTKDEVIAELKPIGFKISLPNKQSRAYYSQDDASSYVVELSFDGSVISTQNGTPGQTLTFTVEREGTYTINVEAYNTENTLIAEGSASKSITFADGYVSVVVALRPKKIETTDPSNPSVTNKVDIGVDIQWVLPEERILTVECRGNSNFTRESNNVNLGKSLVLEFTSGMTLDDIFRENDVRYSLESYESNGKMYDFRRYYEDAEGRTYYQHSMLVDDITLYPIFSVVPKVTYNLNGGSSDGRADDIIQYTDWISKDSIWPQPTKDGLTFVGWTLTPDGEEFVTDIEEDITVYAKYIEVQSCTLTVTTNEHSYFYSDSEGNLVTSITIEFTSGMTLREIFENNNIEYWLEDYYLNDRLYEHYGYQDVNQNEYSSDSLILGDLELTAKYIRVPNVIFNLNGGNINGDYSDVVLSLYDGGDDFPSPVKEGLVLAGWTLTLDGDDFLLYSSGEWNYDLTEWVNEYVFEKDEDLTIYAVWEEPETCTLTLTAPADSYFTRISNGEYLGSYLTLEFTNGTSLGEILVLNDVNYSVASYYDKYGDMYVFDGYYEYYTNGVWITYTSDSIVYDSVTLTPGYSRAPQVTFNLNGGNIDGNTSDVSVYTNYFALQWCPIYPVREGYTLIGWTLTPDGDDFIDQTDYDITVYAKWREKEYYLRGSMNEWGNEEVNPVKFTANEDGSYTIIYTAHEEQSQFNLSTIGYEYWFGGSEVTVDQDDFTIVSSAGNGNGKIVGQYPGNTYKMIAFFYDDYAEVKVETYEQNVSKMSISIPYYDQYFTMNYNGDYYYKTFYFEPEMITELGHTEVVINDDYQYYEAIFTVGETVKLVPGTSESKVIITGGEFAVEYELVVESIDGEYYVSVNQATQDYYIIGDITYGEWEKMIPTDESNVYAFQFTYEIPSIEFRIDPETGEKIEVLLGMGAWGGGDGTANFKILAGNSWGANQVFKNAIVSYEYTLPDFSLDSNAQVNGLVDGLTYTIYLKLENEQYFAKIE